MKKFSEIFTKQAIQALKYNKEEITEELLALMRSFGSEGKKAALEILDLEVDNESYYLDAFGNRMSFNGNRRIKKAYTKMALSEIHKIELRKCAEDIHYFRSNYVRITTPRGVDFPDLREYQANFLDIITPDENESIVSLQPRQSGKTVTVGIYLSHLFIFGKDMNIGIAANKNKQSMEFLDKTKKILIELPIWMQTGISVWNKTFVENENGVRIITDSTSSDSFRGFTCAVVVVDETAFVKSSLWEEFADSIFPSQSGLAWKKNILISTANGLNHFYEIVQGARDETNGYVNFEVNWKDVPRFKSDGSQKTPDEFYTEIVNKYGVIYFNQNYGNEFLGSSHTLISSNKLKAMKSAQAKELRDGKLNIYRYPEEGHQYIMAIDPAKDGTDAFAVQVVDITDFNFKQVASAQLQIDYLLMPEFIFEWANDYNNAYLIIENNEGAGQSIADQMYQTYEYENLHFDNKTDSQATNRTKLRKKYPGFRTTPKTRKQILQTLKLFIENDKLEVVDKATINEFYQFILLNNKFQADDGAHDDMIMSLAVIFAPFCSTKNFEDMKLLVKNLYVNDPSELSEDEKINLGELMTIGSFDDGIEHEEEMATQTRRFQEWNGHYIETDSFGPFNGVDDFDGFDTFGDYDTEESESL